MTTRFIGVKELRQNMAKIAKRASAKKERLIVLRKNEPLFELKPLSSKDKVLERLWRDIEKAREDVRAGRVYTSEEIRKRLGL